MIPCKAVKANGTYVIVHLPDPLECKKEFRKKLKHDLLLPGDGTDIEDSFFEAGYTHVVTITESRKILFGKAPSDEKSPHHPPANRRFDAVPRVQIDRKACAYAKELGLRPVVREEMLVG